MFQGFYNLASGMLTQNKNLNVISNNMTNALTPGFKKDTMVSTTFQEEMIARSGNLDKSNPAQLNTASMIRTAADVVTDFTQGVLEETGNPLDIALTSDGFFQVQTQTGYVYTRNGAFTIDEQGYLSLQDIGRVMGENGPLYLGTDDIYVTSKGLIANGDGAYLGALRIVNFDEGTLFAKEENSVFTTGGQPNDFNGTVNQGYIEQSNVNILDEVVGMMESQRALQSAAQVLRIYDQLMEKATNSIGRI